MRLILHMIAGVGGVVVMLIYHAPGWAYGLGAWVTCLIVVSLIREREE